MTEKLLAVSFRITLNKRVFSEFSVENLILYFASCLDPDSIQIRTKPSGNDSDSDSEMSEGHASLDLASSHSSDEDDDLDLNWDKQLPKNKKIGTFVHVIVQFFFTSRFL